ncbi:MAG: sigma-70 family RNA polymerase sigma factor [Bacteroidota bacterium]
MSHDHFRKDKLKWKESIEDWQDRLGHEENREGEIEVGEKNTMLSLAMDRLPADKREILITEQVPGKKVQEIGEILGCSEGAVKVKVFRALQELKVSINN